MAKGFYGGIGTWETPGITFTQFGQWEETIRVLQRLGPTIKNASIAAQIAVCTEICNRVKNHIVKQDLGWLPLQPEYLARKSELGAYGETLMLWGTYYNAIKVWQRGNQHLVMVGVKKGVYGKGLDGKTNSLDIATIAAIHEFSANSKRRRPLWNPTIREMGGTKGIRALYLAHLYRQLRKRHIPVQYKAGSMRINIDGHKFIL